MRVVTLDGWRKVQTIITDKTWSTPKSRFLDWVAGETIVVLVAREGVVTGEISGPRFRSDLAAWDTNADDWRVPISGIALVKGATGQHLNAGIRDVLKRCYGEPVYFHLLLSGMRLGDEPERLVHELLQGSSGVTAP
jgi:hypothetical protein